ncbi:sugar phosphate isomerase/epimerase [Marinilongibacter aquaticus]|uniref:sugar phosphate isomerase/epimerase family protein n=1 Tax=Marinilongibacter aquaticus TaxID=2975157 RepID=UPI0021BDD829|nr:sugar phosphate isomerase/epimerase [Marinilongibacter aquaticus]UBM58032.1 sugar phosphate isomerase/epimerase [Marinilongibacter aquaticus]
MKRRDFIKSTTVAPAVFDIAFKGDKLKNNLNIHVYNTKWGFSGSYDSFFERSKREGYDGVELVWPTDKADEQSEIFEGLEKHGLEVGFLCQGSGKDASAHLKNYQHMLTQVVEYGGQRPQYINCHAGKDHFSFEENSPIIRFTLDLEQSAGVEIFHETHRGRICFAAQVAEQYLKAFPQLKFNLDISHWTNVHESMLQDQSERLDKIFQKVGLIHTRIGHAESPQVNDPRAPEWAATVRQHLKWWDSCIEYRQKNGFKDMYLMTEFGPPNYMPTLPYTQKPLSDQWDINVYMMHLVKERYK